MPADALPDRSENSWLELVLADASESELHAHRNRLLDRTSPALRDGIQDTAEKALRVQASLAEKRRHSEELTVLNDLARRLSSLRDTPGVLQEVTAQSRRLLAVDVAYIMLVRDDEVLRIEVVDGSIGSTLRGVELSPGRGLGGQVIASGRAIAVEDYLADPRVPHVAEVDQVAADERLGGILGVPLRLGEDVIGVLLAASRTRRKFTDREVTLLASLASHAAIAIYNARTFDELQQSTTTLAEDNRRLERSIELSRAAVELYHRLTRSLVAGADLTEIVTGLAEVIGGRVVVFDARDNVLSGHADLSDSDTAVREIRDLLTTVLGGQSPVQYFTGAATGAFHGTQDGTHLLVAPVTLQDGFAGYVVAQRDRAFDEESVVLAESGAGAIGMSLASERSVAEAERRGRGELLTALLASDVDHASVERRARTRGADLGAVRTVAVVGADPTAGDSLAKVGHRLATTLGAWEAEHGARHVLLIPEQPGHDIVGHIRNAIDDFDEAGASSGPTGDVPCLVGVADCSGGLVAVRAAYEDARRTVDVLTALGRRRAVAPAGEFGVYRTLFSQAGRREAAEFVHDTLAPLLDHDQRHNRDLTGTLASYLGNAQHHARTCAELHIHPNTLYARLERVAELLGEDWRSPDRALHLQLAIRLHHLAGRLDA